MVEMKSEIRDGMQIDWDAPIAMDDGVVLRADVFRPLGDGQYPVILSYGPYAKGLAFQEGYKSNWARIVEAAPEVLAGLEQQVSELGTGRSGEMGAGRLRLPARRLARRRPLARLSRCLVAARGQDIDDCVEWAGTQPWCNGKVGINGISYYAMNQWQVGALRPPHLAALCIWEGSSDYYRELCRHGGILCDFLNTWYPRQVGSVQHGVGERGAKSLVTGEPVAGPDTLPEAELAKNRADSPAKPSGAALDDYYRPHRRLRGHRGAAALRRQLGRHGPASARQFRRLSARRLEAEMARGARRHALHAFLQQLRPGAAEALLRPFPQRRGHRLGQAAARVLNVRHPGEKFVRAPRTNGRSRARNGPNFICSPAGGLAPQARRRRRQLELRHGRRRPDLLARRR